MKVGALLASHTRRGPERVAIAFGDEEVTFAELDGRSDRLANGLLDLGLAPGDRVILYVGNSTALVETAAAAWKAGGVVVPVSTWTVGAELAFMVDDCAPFAIVFGPDQADAVAEAVGGDGAPVLLFIGDDAPAGAIPVAELAGRAAPTPPPALAPQPDDAMIGYTSGTTGKPKGAIITHANLVFQALITATAWSLDEDDVFIVTTPIAHRTGLSRLLSCFCLGSKVVVLPRFDPPAAIATIGRHGVTVFGGVPTVVRLLLDALEPGDTRCDSLTHLLATGEAFPVPLKRRLAERLPGVGLYSFYAITEAGCPAALVPDEQDHRPESVGRPFLGMDIRLMREDGSAAPVGEEGEIEVRCGERGRAAIMRGYFNRPEANAASFDGDWFRTGDVGRFDDDGYLFIVDRVKDMILSAGLNIYSREVENAIESHPAVAETAVVAGPDTEFGECVAAYVVRRDGAAADAAALIEHCRARIASYKKPKYVFFLEALPRNANGKVVKTDLRTRVADDVAAAQAAAG